MNKQKFIISTDSSADYSKSFYEENNINFIVMKRILNGSEIAEVYDSAEEFDNFYLELKKGALPTTTQLNTYELQEYFDQVLEKEKEGDIVHIALSGGLSGSCDNAKTAAEEINKNNSGRKIYVIDSLIASGGMAMLIDRLVEYRDSGLDAADAVAKIENMRNHQHAWVIVSDLFHLKRGGRISGVKAAFGTLLGIKPIIIVNKSGKLVIENTVKGDRKSVQYVLDMLEKQDANALKDCCYPIYLMRSSQNERYNMLKNEILKKYPQIKIKEVIIGPIIGTHLGGGCAAVLFEGKERLKIN